MDVRFLMTGDKAISVQFGNEISRDINLKVKILQYELLENPICGITETVPTYSALMVHYRPQDIRFDRLKEELLERIDNMSGIELPKAIVTEIPVVYGEEYGMDLEDCANLEHISTEEFIRIHSQSEYYIYMLGFAPGHPYTARFENPYHFKRRETPRVKVPGGSIVVSQNLSNILPFEQPCGWNIIGSTPVTLCDYTKENPFLLSAGQWIKYVPISKQEYNKIKQQVADGKYTCKRYEKVV